MTYEKLIENINKKTINESNIEKIALSICNNAENIDEVIEILYQYI